MKKVLLVIVALFCAVSVSAAEGKVKQLTDAVADAKWSVGLRVGTGGEVMAECFYGQNTYLEGRLGLGWIGGNYINFTLLHNWNLCNWDWTPKVGSWYLDAGAGAFVGGWSKVVNFGVTGTVKFGILFKKVPIRLAIDLSPNVGLSAVGKTKVEVEGEVVEAKGGVGFFRSGLLSGGLSATWCF